VRAAAHVRLLTRELGLLRTGGNSKTMMFVNISPADKAAQETMCSLQFARRVRKVQLSATASVENAALNKYRGEVTQLVEERKASSQQRAGR
jgi:kinesin family protein C2/C3